MLKPGVTPPSLPRPERSHHGRLIKCRRGEYVKFLNRMLEVGMVTLDFVPIWLCGLFAVRKGDGLRCVVNGLSNKAFVDPPHVELCTPDVFAKLQHPANTKLWVGKRDLANFYHSLLLPAWLVRYFGLPAVRR